MTRRIVANVLAAAAVAFAYGSALGLVASYALDDWDPDAPLVTRVHGE